MAEFKDVMKKYRKMCRHYDTCSNGCPLKRLREEKDLGCFDTISMYPEEAEKIIMEWEEPIDWSKVPIDTKILVRECSDAEWVKRYFAGVRDGMATAFDGGGTSWSNIGFTTKWKFAKLAEEGEADDL